jgi:hypothetical protein
MATLRLVEHDESAPVPLTGEQVLQLCSELIAEHLPTVPHDDPYRDCLASLGLAVPRRRIR